MLLPPLLAAPAATAAASVARRSSIEEDSLVLLDLGGEDERKGDGLLWIERGGELNRGKAGQRAISIEAAEEFDCDRVNTPEGQTCA